MPVVEVRLFGAPRIEVDGVPSGFNRSRALALLAFLSANKSPVSRDTILGLLWPDFEQADARNGLRRELSLLRQQLGHETIAADRSTIYLTEESDTTQIDVTTFRRLVEQAAEHMEPASQLCADCVSKLKTAAELYTADFLAGFALPDSPAFDEWQYLESEGFRQSFGVVLEKLIEWHTARTDYDQALQYARRRLAIEPTNESSGRTLMQLLAWSGQTSIALREYDVLKQRLRSELDVLPEPETDELAERIRKRELPPPSTAAETEAAPLDRAESQPGHNLPADTTPFVGREQELAQLDELLADPSVRLITIMGPGGMGKTRLAIAAAAQQLSPKRGRNDHFGNGVYMASLAPLSQSGEIVSTLGRVLGYSFDGQTDREQQLITFLQSKNLLLVLDNYEHLLDVDSAGLPGRIIEGAPGVSIIVTSRSRLGSHSETVFVLGGLGMLELPLQIDSPEALDSRDLDAIRANSAVALFTNAAKRAQPEFDVTIENVRDVIRITHLVGGIPLGIELAAGWLSLFTPREIAAEIETSLDFLSSDLADVPERQSSLKSVFETSWRLLPEHEQRAVADLSIFRGGFERRAAEAVVGTSPATLLALVNKSWLQRVHGQRFQIHEMLRQYAEGQLKATTSDYLGARTRHSEYFAIYVDELDQHLKGPDPGPALTAFRQDHENIVSAWEWLVERGHLVEAIDRMLPGIFRYAEARFEKAIVDRATESGLRYLSEHQLDQETSNSARYALQIAKLSFWDSGWPIRYTGYQYTTSDYRQAVLETWQLHGSGSIAYLWSSLGAWLVGMQVDYETGLNFLKPLVNSPPQDIGAWDLSLARQLLASLQAARSPDRLSASQDDLGSQKLLEEALTGFRTIGAVQEQAYTLMAMGFQHQNRGRAGKAVASFGEARDLFVLLGQPLPIASIESLLGTLHLTMADYTEGFELMQSATRRFNDQGKTVLVRGMLSNESYEALRYSTVEHALETRKRALVLSDQLGIRWDNAWDLWELGEIYRYMLRFSEARVWYDRSLAQFQLEQGNHGETFYERGLGDIAQNIGDYAEAYARFQASLRLTESSLHAWSHVYALRGLGDAALGLGNLSLARDHLADALRISYEQHTLPGDPGGLYLTVFAAVARLFHGLGLDRDADELARYVLAHPLTWNETRRDLEKLQWTKPVPLRVLGDEDKFLEFMTLSRELVAKLQAIEIPS